MTTKKPSLLVALVPVAVLVFLLIVNVIMFKDDSSYGPNQIALLIAAGVSGIIGLFHLKMKYDDIEEGAIHSIGLAMQANMILLVVGTLIGTWILAGIVPSMIYYGLKIISPAVFLPLACIVCCIVSLGTGSSWSTTGTVGIALIGIGSTLGFSEGMVAGAVISGAYFGDKMSPLSDTTNLAPAMAGTDIFTHIKHMLYTTIPSITLALIGFSILSMTVSTSAATSSEISQVLGVIDSNFNVGVHLFLAPAIVLFMVAKKVPALPALAVGAILGAVFAIIFQQDLLSSLVGGELTAKAVYAKVMSVAFGGFEIETGNKMIDKLLSRGGMSGMLNTVWLILTAMIFGGVMERTGMLDRIANTILKMVSGAGSLVGATVGSCIFLNMSACDQYLAIVVPGRMFRSAYKKFGLHPKNLSRSLEDAGTVTSVLIPWNTGGAYNSSVLGVATVAYLPYCFFNLISPVMSVFMASFNLSIEKLKDDNNEYSDEDLATV